ncbi:MAG TPA: MFS transporter, partial [Solirubrobacterales bacterium]|nr:MFS transporter [Solirubrobacterales bacterium]
ALGIYGMGNIGTAVAAFSIPAIRDATSEGVAGLVFAAVIGVYALIWMSMAREAPVEKAPPTRYREVLGAGWKLWRLALFYFVTFGGFVAMALYLPKLLVDWYDLSLTDAGLRAAGFTLLATAIRPVGGMLSDRIGGNRVLAVAFLGIGIDAVGLSWQASVPTMWLTTVFCLTMALFLGLGNGAVFKLVPLTFPNATGAATGIVGAVGGLGGFFPPLFLGIVKDATGDFVLAFVMLVAFAWLCAGLAFEGRVPDSGTNGPD